MTTEDLTKRLNRPALPARKGRPSAEETLNRQQAVLEAARAEFVAKGYRSSTMDEIAARAGVSKRSLYLWYEDKAALFRACYIEGALDLQLPRLDPALDAATALTTYGAVLLPAISTSFSIKMARLLYRESFEFDDVREALAEGTRLTRQPVTDYLEAQGLERGEADRLAVTFLSALTSHIQMAILIGGPVPDLTASMLHLGTTVRIFSPTLTALAVD